MDEEFSEFFEWLEKNIDGTRKITTLGGQSEFLPKYKNGQLAILDRRCREFKKHEITSVFERYFSASLSYRHKTNYYGNIWAEEGGCPDSVIAPYVAAIVRDYNVSRT